MWTCSIRYSYVIDVVTAWREIQSVFLSTDSHCQSVQDSCDQWNDATETQDAESFHGHGDDSQAAAATGLLVITTRRKRRR